MNKSTELINSTIERLKRSSKFIDQEFVDELFQYLTQNKTKEALEIYEYFQKNIDQVNNYLEGFIQVENDLTDYTEWKNTMDKWKNTKAELLRKKAIARRSNGDN